MSANDSVLGDLFGKAAGTYEQVSESYIKYFLFALATVLAASETHILTSPLTLLTDASGGAGLLSTGSVWLTIAGQSLTAGFFLLVSAVTMMYGFNAAAILLTYPAHRDRAKIVAEFEESIAYAVALVITVGMEFIGQFNSWVMSGVWTEGTVFVVFVGAVGYLVFNR